MIILCTRAVILYVAASVSVRGESVVSGLVTFVTAPGLLATRVRVDDCTPVRGSAGVSGSFVFRSFVRGCKSGRGAVLTSVFPGSGATAA